MPTALEVVTLLLREQPAFHGDGRVSWSASAGLLGLLADLVRPGHVTIETGSGASTAVFAAAGASHIAISPAPDEHARVLAWCEAKGILTTGLRFFAEPSDVVLPRLAGEGRLDLGFVDGSHSFPPSGCRRPLSRRSPPDRGHPRAR